MGLGLTVLWVVRDVDSGVKMLLGAMVFELAVRLRESVDRVVVGLSRGKTAVGIVDIDSEGFMHRNRVLVSFWARLFSRPCMISSLKLLRVCAGI